jgi:hypothetical protein
MVKGYSALKFKFDKKVGRSEEGTGLNKISPGITPDRVGVRKIIKFIYIGRKFFIKQENRFKKAVFRR